MASLVGAFEAWWQKDEEWVFSFMQKLRSGAVVVEGELTAAFAWLGTHAGEIQQDAQMVAQGVALAQAKGIAVPQSVITAINEAQVAVSTLSSTVNAAAAPGANVASVLVSAYTSAKQAQASVAVAAGQVILQMPVVSAPVQGN